LHLKYSKNGKFDDVIITSALHSDIAILKKFTNVLATRVKNYEHMVKYAKNILKIS